jgi:hypothetical protein
MAASELSNDGVLDLACQRPHTGNQCTKTLLLL